MNNPQINIVLIEPEIPQNTGNVGRTCIGLGARLHLVGKLGFSLEDKYLKRAGLDYWPKLNLKVHESWESFLASCPEKPNLYLFSTHGKTSLWDVQFKGPAYLVFGAESHGFPPHFYNDYKEELIRIPINGDIRSLNMSVACGVAVFEVMRQWK